MGNSVVVEGHVESGLCVQQYSYIIGTAQARLMTTDLRSIGQHYTEDDIAQAFLILGISGIHGRRLRQTRDHLLKGCLTGGYNLALAMFQKSLQKIQQVAVRKRPSTE